MKEKNKNNFNSLIMIITSILICLYLAFYVGWLMNVLGGYQNEGEGPDRHHRIIVFLHVLPALIIQLLYLIKCYKIKESSLRLLTNTIVILTFLYAIYMVVFSMGGVSIIVLLSMAVIPVTICLLPVFLICYLIFKLIKFLKNKKDNHE